MMIYYHIMMIYHCRYHYYYNHYYWKLNIRPISVTWPRWSLQSYSTNPAVSVIGQSKITMIIIIVSTIYNNFVFMVTKLCFIIYYFQKKVRGEFTFFLFHLKCWRKISTRIGWVNQPRIAFFMSLLLKKTLQGKIPWKLPFLQLYSLTCGQCL